MDIHKNARLTPFGRERLVKMVLDGQTPKAVSEAVGVSPRTVRKWIERYNSEGLAGLQDRSSRPKRLRQPTPQGMALTAGDRPNSVAAWRRMIRPTDVARSPVEQLPKGPALASAPSSLQAIREKVSFALDGGLRRGLWIGVGAVALTAIVASALIGGLYLTREDRGPSPAVATGGPVSAARNQAKVSDPIETEARAILQSLEEKMNQAERTRQDAEAKRQAEAKAEAERNAAAQEAKRQAEAKAEADRQAAAAQEAKRQAEAKAEADRQAAVAQEAKRQVDAKAEADRQAAVQEAKRQADAKAEADRQAAAAQEAKRQADAKAEADRQAAAAQEAKRQADAKAEAAAELVPPSPSAPAPVIQQAIRPTASEPEGAPGLLVRARSGESLQTLYLRVYRGLTPPPFASVAAINPERIRPGDILTFPTPVNGWDGRNDADAVSNIR